jgi:hypothetical protein
VVPVATSWRGCGEGGGSCGKSFEKRQSCRVQPVAAEGMREKACKHCPVARTREVTRGVNVHNAGTPVEGGTCKHCCRCTLLICVFVYSRCAVLCCAGPQASWC